MEPTEQTCNTSRIDEYLDERLDETQLGEFETHLTTCDFCQIELQRRAAEPEVWQDAVSLLSDQVADSNEVATDAGAPKSRNAMGVLNSLAPTDDPEMLGRIGEYEVSGVVGVGGMGAVLKGFDRSLRRVVAIKVMAPHLADSGSARTRFQREARAAAAITHDNVIDTYGVSEANGLPYLVMPFARGPSLQKRIDESGPLTAIEVVRIGRQVASGLAAAHEQGLVHRDIKPANILLAEGIERLWITDFGVARAIDDASMTRTGVIAGTPQYMSPEQARGEHVDNRSDLFSLGSVLYTACTGRPPFRAEAAYGILRRITDTEPRAIRELNPDVPEWLCRVIERLMAKDANLRFESATEVAELLEGCLAHMQQPTMVDLPQTIRNNIGATSSTRTPTVLPETQTEASKAKRTRLWTLAAAAMLAAFGLIAWQQTKPVDISGNWSGERWESVSLQAVNNASGWYSGSFTDKEGRKGAIQLEWSRLHRQYNGRWRIGDQLSGDVTVRPQTNELRGAITVDLESALNAETPRLRDYAWQRSSKPDATKGLADSKPGGPLPGYPIASPIAGRIIRWSDKISENARVKKGSFICEIAEVDSGYTERNQSQLSTLEEVQRATRRQIKTLQNNLLTKEEVFEAYTSRYQTFSRVASSAKSAKENAMKAAQSNVEAARAKVTASKAKLDQAEVNLARQEKLMKENVTSPTKLAKAKSKLQEAEAAFAASNRQLKTYEALLSNGLSDLETKLSKAMLDVDEAKIEWVNARVAVSQAQNDLESADRKIEESKKEIAELKTKLARRRTSQILAPYDGVITQIVRTTMVEAGDFLCVLVREPDVAVSDAPSKPRQPVRYVPERVRRSVANGISAAYEVAISLGQQFRKLMGSGEEFFDGQKSEVTAVGRQALRERDTSIAILEAQLTAAENGKAVHKRMLDQVRQRVEQGDVAKFSVYEPQIALLESNGKAAELRFLLDYYRQLGGQPVPVAADTRLAKDVLETKLDIAKKRLDLQRQVARVTRERFKIGQVESGEAMLADDKIVQTEAEVGTIEALLKHHADDAIYAPLELEVDAAVGTQLARPKNEQERQTFLKLLTVRLESASARLKASRKELQRTQTLVDEVIKPTASLVPLKSEVAEHEALVKTLQIQLEHYRSIRPKK